LLCVSSVRAPERGDLLVMTKQKHRKFGADGIDKKKLATAVAGIDGADAASEEVGDSLSMALKAVLWLASPESKEQAELCEALLEAARPLVLARAAKYEEEAKVAKVAAAAIGNPANARAGRPASHGAPKKRSFEEAHGGSSSASSFKVEEVAEASKALRELAEQPEELMSKACKPLRAALHPLVEAHLREEKSSPAFRITSMLGQQVRWPEALRVLSAIRSDGSKARPKLGAYQRWVRELNVSEGDPTEVLMMDAIMRVAAGFPASSQQIPPRGTMYHFPPWAPSLPASDGSSAESGGASSSTAPASASEVAGVGEAGEAGEGQHTSTISKLASLITTRREEAKAGMAGGAGAPSSLQPGSWSVLAHEAAHERTPPNHFDLDIYNCAPGVLTLNSPASRPTARHEVPGVEGALVLSDLLSAAECSELRLASEAIGYRPDVPLSSELDERAHNVVLMATEQQNNTLFERARALLPQQFGGDTLVGLNRRWRLYRYQAGNLYRKHLDGAWPASGIKVGAKGKQEYVYDAHGEGTRSRLTFIVYLNDDFEGGATTFFVPSAGSEGTLESRPVKPRIGSASVWNHGDTGVPLLHEGSSVVSGTKYLLRTDVVYAAPKTPAELKHIQRLRGLARQMGGLGGFGGQGLVEEADSSATGGEKAKKRHKTMKPNMKKERKGQKNDKGQAAGEQGGKKKSGSQKFGSKGQKAGTEGASGAKSRKSKRGGMTQKRGKR